MTVRSERGARRARHGGEGLVTPDGSGQPGLWRSVGRGWRVFVATVVVAAVLQTLLVVAVATSAVSPALLLALAGAFATAVLTVWLLAAGAVAAVHGERLRLRPAALGWSAVVVGLAAASAVLLPRSPRSSPSAGRS